MAAPHARIFILVASLIFCYAALSSLYTFRNNVDNNPIKVIVSDDVFDFESSADSSVKDHTHEDHLSLPSKIEAIYQFGDSISDTGNIIHIDPRSVFAKSPYGRTFSPKKPTGRCSDGLLMIDYFAKYLNLPFLDPYLNKNGNFTHGVNFAVAGAPALNASALAMKGLTCFANSSLSVQLDWFKSHLGSICSTVSECKEKLTKSLIMMGEIGGNDYNIAFIQRKPMSEVYELVPEVVQVIKNAVKEVVDLGAIRVVVPGNFPVGCLSVSLASSKTDDSNMYDELQCLKGLNSFAKFHNDKLQQAIEELQKDHPHAKIVYADYFSAMRDILQNATSLGFDKDALLKVCCGFGNNQYNFDIMRMCGYRGAIVCEHPDKHVSWDGVHLTQHTYQLMAKWLIKNNFQHIFSIA